MTLEQIKQQPADPFVELLAWRGRTTVSGSYISWQLHDMTMDRILAGLTSRTFLMDVDKAQYVDELTDNIESYDRSIYRGDRYAANNQDDWECGTKERFAKWLCRELRVPYDS
jgi:hypothetical protein